MADWTHITVKQPDSPSGYNQLVYHITLMTMKVGTSINDFLISGDDFDWLQEVSEECNKLQATEKYPDEVCKQSRSLYVSGIIVSKNLELNTNLGSHTSIHWYPHESVPGLLDMEICQVPYYPTGRSGKSC